MERALRQGSVDLENWTFPEQQSQPLKGIQEHSQLGRGTKERPEKCKKAKKKQQLKQSVLAVLSPVSCTNGRCAQKLPQELGDKWQLQKVMLAIK